MQHREQTSSAASQIERAIKDAHQRGVNRTVLDQMVNGSTAISDDERVYLREVVAHLSGYQPAPETPVGPSDATPAAYTIDPAALLITPAERVLGALLAAGNLSPTAAATVLAAIREHGVTAATFEREQDRVIYTAIETVIDRGDPADFLIVEAELARTGRLKAAGGNAYVRELSNLNPAIANAPHFAHLLAEEQRNRDLERAALRLVEASREGHITDELRGLVTQALEQPLHLQVRDRLVPGGTFILDTPDTADAVWGEGDEIAWAAGEGLMIAGPQGVGKTTIAQQLVLARIGIRTHVLGLPVAASDKPVLYIAADRPRQAQRSLARMVTPDQRQILDERLVVHKGPPDQLADHDPRILARLAARAGAATIVIDSLKDVALELSREETGAKLNIAFQTCIAEGVELLVLHHQRKASTENKKPAKLDDVFGSGRITSGLGSVLLLWGEPGDVLVELRHLKQPREELGPWNLQHDHNQGLTTIAGKADYLDLLYRSGTQGLTATAAASLVFEKESPTRNEVEKARRRLKKLVDEGRAMEIPGRHATDPPRYYLNAGTQQAAR